MYVVEFYLPDFDTPAAVLVSRTADLSGAVATAEQREKLTTARPAVLAGPLPGMRAFWLAGLRRRQLGIASGARSGLYRGRPCVLIRKSAHDGRPLGEPLGPFLSLAAAGRFLGRNRRDVGVALRTGRGCAGYYVLDATEFEGWAGRDERSGGAGFEGQGARREGIYQP